MEDIKDKKIGELVAEDYKYADVFKKYGIDFCCGGGVTIEEICKRKSLDYNLVINDLKQVNADTDVADDFNHWKLDRLIDHIIDAHHAYVKENLPLLMAYSTKVAQVHGPSHPETIKINRLIENLVDELLPHMEKEEVVLFPYIKKLLKIENGNRLDATLGTVENPIKAMISEHEVAGDIMRQIAELSSEFTPPAGACNTYIVLYNKLRHFEEDLHRHIHLENNILFPKAIAIEKEKDADYQGRL